MKIQDSGGPPDSFSGNSSGFDIPGTGSPTCLAMTSSGPGGASKVRVSAPATLAAQPLEDFAMLTDDLGPGAVQACRLLASHPEDIAQEVRMLLARLPDRAPEMPWSTIRLALLNDLRAAPEMLFAWIDKRPFRSVYFAQYHRARTHTNEPVVVKIARPGISAQALHEVDRSTFASLLPRVDAANGLTAEQLEDEWKEYVARTLDYVSQARNLERLHRLNATYTRMRYAKVYPDLSGPTVLVTEDIHGVGLPEVLDRVGGDPPAVAEQMIEAFVEQVLESPLLNVNIYPENLVSLPGGGVVFLDFEHVRAVNEELRQHIVACVRSILAADIEDLHQRIIDLSQQSDRAGAAAFRAWFIAEAHRGLQGLNGVKSSAAFLSEGLQTARRNGVQLDAAALALLRALLTVIELARQINPDIDIGSACRRAVTRWQVRATMESFRPERLLSHAEDALALLRDGPAHLRRLLQHLEEERLRIPVLTAQSVADRVAANRRSKLQGLCLIATSLAILLGVASQIPWLAWPAVYGIISGAMVAVLAAIVVVWRSLE